MNLPIYRITSNSQYVRTYGNKFYIFGGAPRIDFPYHEPNYQRIKFTYLGVAAVEDRVALANGTYSYQIGMKMRNSNPCNISYVMRKVDAIDISVKENIGMTTSAQCGAGGYTQYYRASRPALEIGKEYTLAARYAKDTDTLIVYENGEHIWTGEAPLDDSIAFSGMRTDNIKAIVELI